MLELIFEAQCELLNSKFPESYSSFKITINLNNLDKALDVIEWSRDTLVTRSFLKATHPADRNIKCKQYDRSSIFKDNYFIRLVHVNCQSITNKMLLENFICTISPDILCITEQHCFYDVLKLMQLDNFSESSSCCRVDHNVLEA
mgnify:CR=1 FL=1